MEEGRSPRAPRSCEVWDIISTVCSEQAGTAARARPKVSPTSAADERRLVFDPANRTDGIDLSTDPILAVRSAAYSISYDRRSKGE
jgi:hypothetical protein